VTMDGCPENRIKEIETEYTERKHTSETVKPSVRIGHFFLNTETNILYVCTGRINGQPVWSEVIQHP
jgi:hypothetical protein